MNAINKSLFEKVCFNTDIRSGCDIDGNGIFNDDEKRANFDIQNKASSESSLKLLMLKYGAPKLAKQAADIYYIGPTIQNDSPESFRQPVKSIRIPSENPIEGYARGFSDLKKVMDGALTSFAIEPTIDSIRYTRKIGRSFKNNFRANIQTGQNALIALYLAVGATGREEGGKLVDSIKHIPEALLVLGINILTLPDKPPFEQGRIIGQAAHFIAPALGACKLAKATKYRINAFLDDRFNFKKMGAPISKEEIRRLNAAYAETNKTRAKPKVEQLKADKPKSKPKNKKPIDVDAHVSMKGRRNKIRASRELAQAELEQGALVKETLRKKIFSNAEKETILRNLDNLNSSPHPMAEIISLDAYDTFRSLIGGQDLTPMSTIIQTIAKERGLRPFEVTTILYKDMLELKIYLGKARINRLKVQASLPDSTDFNLFLSIEKDCLAMLHDIDIHLGNFSPSSTAASRWVRQ